MGTTISSHLDNQRSLGVPVEVSRECRYAGLVGEMLLGKNADLDNCTVSEKDSGMIREVSLAMLILS